MRCFIGLPISKEVTDYLTEIQTAMKQKGIKGNYTDSSNFHVTLKYIGEVDDDAIMKKLTMSLNQAPLTLEIKKISHFNRKIVWIGLEPNHALTELHLQVEKELILLGLVDPSAFIPHITLCRKANFFEEVSLGHMTFEVDSVILYESKRVNGKLSYIPRKEFSLKKVK